jgi:hypothetical protein
MFCEASRALLKGGGYLGLIVPSGIYTDKGATDLRRLFLEKSRWEWLFGFENREKLFDIDSRFKFNPIIVRKGGKTSAIRTAFMHRSVEDWQDAERHVLPYPRERVEQFSPRSSAILEIRSEQDLAVLEKMYASSVLLGDDGSDGWGIQYRQGDFNMTSDSRLFPPRPWWEERGYKPNEYGLWIGPQGEVALPLYEGRMIGQFDFSEKGWVSGKGRSAVWRPIPFEHKVLEPQFCMAISDYTSATDREGKPKPVRGVKLGFMDVSSATNERTMVAALVPDAPCGNKVPVLATEARVWEAELCAVLNSFAYDYQLRCRLGGLTLNYFIIEETALPKQSLISEHLEHWLRFASLRLCGIGGCFSIAWKALPVEATRRRWRELWAVTALERLRLRCIADAVVAELYGLDPKDLTWILRDCDHPTAAMRSDEFTRALNPKGFWRIDKERDPELRHTVLTLVAFHELKRLGLDAFLAQNDGEGWMLPDTLRLADYGLGHDDRAKEPQPVASRLGPRFLPWQLEQGVEESWEECARHAERLAALLGRPLATGAGNADAAPPPGASKPTDLFGQPLQTDLFGNVVEPQARRRR